MLVTTVRSLLLEVNIAVFADPDSLLSLFLEVGPIGQLRGRTRTLKQKILSTKKISVVCFSETLCGRVFPGVKIHTENEVSFRKKKKCHQM